MSAFEPEPMPVPEPRNETNLMRRLESANATQPQTTDCTVVYPLNVPFVRYHPAGYTVQLESGLFAPRDILLVTFPIPINLLRDFDVERRTFLRDYIAFYRSTATSTTSILPELRDTWFPTFGVIPNYHIMKISSLEPGNYSWKANLDMFVRVEQMLDRTADRKISPYVYMFGIQNNPELLIQELAARTSSWQFLRISAAIGGGIWDIETRFREFVLARNFVNRDFILEAFPEGIVKSPVFKTTQICDVLGPHELPLFKCRLDDVFTVKKVGDDQAAQYFVEYKATA